MFGAFSNSTIAQESSHPTSANNDNFCAANLGYPVFDLEDLDKMPPADSFDEEEHPLILHQPSQSPSQTETQSQTQSQTQSLQSRSSHSSSNASPQSMGVYESEIVDQDGCKKLLMVMCYGLTDAEGKNIGDTTLEPYASWKKKTKLLKPKNMDSIDKIKRRCNESGTKIPKCKNWTAPNLYKFLLNNPITNETDVAYLTKEE